MQDTVYSLLFLASAPIALMPAAIALLRFAILPRRETEE
jgi:hypothetical protein